jgi:hypothetical protein
MDEVASLQLAALARIDERLDEAGVAYWLFGGWAVDWELTFLARDADGRIGTPLSHGPAVWPDSAFAGDVGELHGVRARLLARAALVQGKSRPRDDPQEASKDRADHAYLSRG